MSKSSELDVNLDGVSDFTFELINLKEYNTNFPYTDTMAARVIPLNGNKVIDNSTIGYPDALIKNELVEGNWNSDTCVLGTFHPGGGFKGAGDRYLGIATSEGTPKRLGWVLLNCDAHNQELIIKAFSLRLIPGEVYAGVNLY